MVQLWASRAEPSPLQESLGCVAVTTFRRRLHNTYNRHETLAMDAPPALSRFVGLLETIDGGEKNTG